MKKLLLILIIMIATVSTAFAVRNQTLVGFEYAGTGATDSGTTSWNNDLGFFIEDRLFVSNNLGVKLNVGFDFNLDGKHQFQTYIFDFSGDIFFLLGATYKFDLTYNSALNFGGGLAFNIAYYLGELASFAVVRPGMGLSVDYQLKLENSVSLIAGAIGQIHFVNLMRVSTGSISTNFKDTVVTGTLRPYVAVAFDLNNHYSSF